MDTEGHPKGALYTGSWLQEVGVSRVIVQGGVIYDVRIYPFPAILI